MRDRVAHFKLPVSFFIVKNVVPHGKWASEKIITHIAVLYDQPFAINRDFSAENDSKSMIAPADM